jgi:hypothetical protein
MIKLMTKGWIPNTFQPVLKRVDNQIFETFRYATHFIQQGWLVKIDQIGNFFVGMKPLDADPIKIDYDQIRTLQEKMAVFAETRRFEFL